MQWQPIETAPKNSNLLLNIEGKIVIGYYYLPWNAWRADFSEQDKGEMPMPTHWMPLPELPEENK